MNHINFKQIIGGVSIMLSVMFLLVMAENIQQVEQASNTLWKGIDTNLAKPLDPSGEMKNPPAPENVVSGSFNPTTNGTIVYYNPEDEKTLFYYKAIRSDKLKDATAKPSLKLQIDDAGTLTWKDIEWSWIDYDQGILYFHYLTEEEGIQEKIHDFTGNYQLIF